MKLIRTHIACKQGFAILLFSLLASLSSTASIVNFYGHSVQFQDFNFTQTTLSRTNQTYLNQFNKKIRTSDIVELSEEIRQQQTAFNLDDIGMLKMLDQRLQKIYRDHNRQVFLKWRILKHLQYDVLLTYSNNKLDCFATTDFRPLENVYIVRNKKRYNNLNFKDKRTYGNRFVYKGETAVNKRKLHFDSKKTPRIFKKQKRKEIAFKYNLVEYNISAVGNASLMDYYNDLPTIDFSKSYINSGFSELAKSTVIKELKQATAKMTKRETIGFLLRFVQSSFLYKTDYQNHGHEKYNFPEETLFSNFSDCEDRSLLLAGLVREILDLNSVALYFEKDQHMSLAIEMSEYTNGYSFKFDKKFFVACEPTGRNYRFGQSAIALSRVTKVYKLY
jgi:hypothetical protein